MLSALDAADTHLEVHHAGALHAVQQILNADSAITTPSVAMITGQKRGRPLASCSGIIKLTLPIPDLLFKHRPIGLENALVSACGTRELMGLQKQMLLPNAHGFDCYLVPAQQGWAIMHLQRAKRQRCCPCGYNNWPRWW